MNNKVFSDFLFRKEKISGWGRRDFVTSSIIDVHKIDEIKAFIKKSQKQFLIPRGLGRSYGDAAQLSDEYVLNSRNLNKINVMGDEVIVGGGVSIYQLLETIIPLGYFIPVSPGSSKVTIGGAIAADVHGKNHHKDGSLGNHLLRILILDGNGEIKELVQNSSINKQDADFFWATVGGMGLTGLILEATIKLKKIESSFMKVDTFICNHLDELMELMMQKDLSYSYSVAWVDSLDKNNRGVLTCGEHALKDEINTIDSEILSFDSNSLGNAPNLFPNGILNRFTVKAFNEIWFRKSVNSKKHLQPISDFFYPLDSVNNWNRIYGPNGFIQYQFVVPEDKAYFISRTLNKLKSSSANSFLTVLKRFGKSNNGFLSFPNPGWTLAIDLPGSTKGLLTVLDELDDELQSIGGKLYLAKDSRQTSSMFKKTYKNLEQWLSIKYQMDPKNIFQSDLSRRLKI